MASEKQIAANRKNAAKSTGPRTQQGKARSKMNALRHGFAAKGSSGEMIKHHSTMITITGSSEKLNTASVELQNIRVERTKLLAQLLDAVTPDRRSQLLRKIASLQRYDGKAYANRKRLHRG